MPPPVEYNRDADFERRRAALENAFDTNALRCLVKAHDLEVGDAPSKSDLLDTLAKSDVTVPGVDVERRPHDEFPYRSE